MKTKKSSTSSAIKISIISLMLLSIIPGCKVDIPFLGNVNNAEKKAAEVADNTADLKAKIGELEKRIEKELGDVDIDEILKDVEKEVEKGFNEEFSEVAPKEAAPTKQALPSRTDVAFNATSTLIDISGYGISYEPKNIADVDFSTAWCESSGNSGNGETISMVFPNEIKLSRVGIMPGYGLNADYFFESNSLKTFTLTFSDNTTVEFTARDEYNMQFFDFPEKTTNKITLTIKDVYFGTVYNDTCISEIDIWSDWVASKDAAAAMQYYETNKQPLLDYPVIENYNPDDYYWSVCDVNDPNSYCYDPYYYNYCNPVDPYSYCYDPYYYDSCDPLDPYSYCYDPYNYGIDTPTYYY